MFESYTPGETHDQSLLLPQWIETLRKTDPRGMHHSEGSGDSRTESPGTLLSLSRAKNHLSMLWNRTLAQDDHTIGKTVGS